MIICRSRETLTGPNKETSLRAALRHGEDDTPHCYHEVARLGDVSKAQTDGKWTKADYDGDIPSPFCLANGKQCLKFIDMEKVRLLNPSSNDAAQQEDFNRRNREAGLL